MKNISQSIVFPVSSILRSEMDEALQGLLARTRNTKRLVESLKSAKIDTEEGLAGVRARQEELDGLEAEIGAATGDKIKKELAFYGADKLTDDVLVHMRLGTVLFDLYMRMTPEPQAPLSKLIWKKRAMELAEAMESEEIAVPSWASDSMVKALSDEDIWKSTSLTVWVEIPVEGQEEKGRRYFTINTRGTVFFAKILEAAAEILYKTKE